MTDAKQPPFVVLEHLIVGGQELVRIAAWSNDESEAHVLATAMAHAGLRVWLIDL